LTDAIFLSCKNLALIKAKIYFREGCQEYPVNAPEYCKRALNKPIDRRSAQNRSANDELMWQRFIGIVVERTNTCLDLNFLQCLDSFFLDGNDSNRFAIIVVSKIKVLDNIP
jgi:hypothetical protein